jgi:hypothetical protein
MSDEKKSKLIERDKAMRIARDEMLRLYFAPAEFGVLI